MSELTRRWFAPCCFAALSLSVAAAGDVREPVVRIEDNDGLTTLSVVVPGRLISYALPRTSGGTREIALLVAPKRTLPPQDTEEPADGESGEQRPRLPPCPSTGADAPRMAIYRVATHTDGMPPPTVGELPDDCTALDAADVDGDGTEELLLARPGKLLVIDDGRVETVLEDRDLGWSSVHPRVASSSELDGRPLLTTEPLGGLRLYGAASAERGWSGLAAADLPLTGRVRANGLTVRNPIPRFVGLNDAGGLLYATQPEALGTRRLRVSLVTLHPSGGSEVTECWARLPEPEEVLESHFLMIDGRPMLLVTTKPANKLTIFGEKRLRLYPLKPDRSRHGANPSWAESSRMNLWQRAHPKLVDVNGDGREDLVIGYWKGLKKENKVVLDVYLRHAEGYFDDGARTTAFQIEPRERERPRPSDSDRAQAQMRLGDRSFLEYGRDLDGDGIPDLLVRDEDDLLLYPGLPSSSGKSVVSSKDPVVLPTIGLGAEMDEIVVEMGSQGFRAWIKPTPGRPRLVDLDGDGASEILVVHTGAGDQPDVLSVLSAAP